MDLSITSVPNWLSILFAVTFFFIPPFLIAKAAQYAYNTSGVSNGQNIKKNILYFYWLYFTAVGIISLLGVFSVNTLPPRIIIITVVPLFLFYLLYLPRKNWFKTIIQHIQLEQLIYIHVFRFVGIFFFLVNYYGALPDFFSIIGGTGDMLTAILVFPVIYALKRKYNFSKILVWIWNIIGLLDIISVLITAISVTKYAIVNDKAGVIEFGTFPFSWIPAFAPATIIFLHVLIFKKLIEKQKTQE
ncbi:hypothetical protein [Tenacibaculum jejuense]|uniref:Uncharacterized protein n=1 Tax=Tenacibaculum jejuense TaxID=584609 RepID=A0A238UF61_9FLAO|nr:hypothetical protein [Tenacibaculum jejuense]SNR17218.1 conserved membrane protein of unknown function [Tenacibaculum jejuense]